MLIKVKVTRIATEETSFDLHVKDGLTLAEINEIALTQCRPWAFENESGEIREIVEIRECLP